MEFELPAKAEIGHSAGVRGVAGFAVMLLKNVNVIAWPNFCLLFFAI
jgi:hypothetical protein